MSKFIYFLSKKKGMPARPEGTRLPEREGVVVGTEFLDPTFSTIQIWRDLRNLPFWRGATCNVNWPTCHEIPVAPPSF